MRHFSCDLCGSALTPGSGPRMVLKLESYPAPDDDRDADDRDADVVEEVALILEEAEETGAAAVPTTRKVAFDLCVPCHRKVMANPLGRGRAAAPRFSGN